MKKSTKWFSLAAALSVTAIVGTGCSISGGNSHKDTKQQLKQNNQMTHQAKTTKTENSDFVLRANILMILKK